MGGGVARVAREGQGARASARSRTLLLLLLLLLLALFASPPARPPTRSTDPPSTLPPIHPPARPPTPLSPPQVFNCTPDLLLPAVRDELERLLCHSPTILESYIRPGGCPLLPSPAPAAPAPAAPAPTPAVKGLAGVKRPDLPPPPPHPRALRPPPLRAAPLDPPTHPPTSPPPNPPAAPPLRLHPPHCQRVHGRPGGWPAARARAQGAPVCVWCARAPLCECARAPLCVCARGRWRGAHVARRACCHPIARMHEQTHTHSRSHLHT